jgi:3'(2'), 5'-bisphosphate nucleotidase
MRTLELTAARDAVRSAAAALLALRERSDVERGRELADLGDALAHELVVSRLREAFPHDVVLSEEGEPVPAARRPQRLWVVDPLDGTREFSSGVRTDWAVQVALVEGETPVLGVVALPAQGVELDTGAALQCAPRPTGPLRIAVSRSRPPAVAEQLADALGAELVPLGSVGAKTAAVIAGAADVYVHAGGQYEWDSAGPVAVARAAGLEACRLDGSPLRYNQPDPYLPDLVIARPEVAGAVRAALDAVLVGV